MSKISDDKLRKLFREYRDRVIDQNILINEYRVLRHQIDNLSNALDKIIHASGMNEYDFRFKYYTYLRSLEERPIQRASNKQETSHEKN